MSNLLSLLEKLHFLLEPSLDQRGAVKIIELLDDIEFEYIFDDQSSSHDKETFANIKREILSSLNDRKDDRFDNIDIIYGKISLLKENFFNRF